MEAAKRKYILKLKQEVIEGKRGSSYSAMRKLGVRDSETNSNILDLPQHLEENLTPSQSAERIADFFSSISQEYDPLVLAFLPPNLRNYMESARGYPNPHVLQEYKVYQKIMKSKKPSSLVPGDLPVKLVKEFDVELSIPITKIFNKINQTLEYPSQWKIEYQTPIPKVPHPVDEGQLRNISKTSFFSKNYESFLCDWLLPFINPFLDPGQCGGLSQSSITHYLIKLLHFCHYNLDQRDPHAVILAMVDMMKAFNRVSHNILMQDLFDMHVPGWLLCIIASYLSSRSMILHFHGAQSSRRELPGGGPQGALLGGIIFIVKFNGAALRPSIPRFIFTPQFKNQLKERNVVSVKLT